MPIAGLAMGDLGAHEAHAADRTDDVPISGGNAKMMGPRSPVRLPRQQSWHCAGKAFSATYNRIENSLQSTAHERMFPKAARPAKQQLWFPAGRYFLRTIKREDASERWAEWLSDPWTVHVLNTPPRRMTKSDIADYIKTFDQRERLLLGIFERGSRAHVGFIRLDIDF